MFGALLAVWRVIVEVLSFWRKVNLPCCFVIIPPQVLGDRHRHARMAITLMPTQKLLGWYTRKNPVDLWLELLRNAEAFEDWEEAALHLDNLLGLDHWFVATNIMPVLGEVLL